MAAMEVGVNYPWFDYGWDVGLGPPAWLGGRDTPRWFDHLDEHLARLSGIGVRVVRWFVLADGLTYGTGAEAPRLDGLTPTSWRFHPPRLDQAALDHFDEILKRFARATAAGAPIRLLPVFIDFPFCQPGLFPVETVDPVDPLRTRPDLGWVKQGRADAIVDAGKRARLLGDALEPLLHVSASHREVIYAWDLINEPEWITSGWHPDPQAHPPVPEAAMRAFLAEGKDRVRAAGFKPTIGFWSIGTLQRSGITAEINQFHHYPGGTGRLDPHGFDPRFPGIIGEFATSPRDVWPELARDRQGVGHRLQLAASRGYPLALAWSFRADDEHTAWSRQVEEEIRVFGQEDGDRL